MSVWGQTRRFDLLSITSDMPSASDVSGPGRHFAKVPSGDAINAGLADLIYPSAGTERGSELGRGQCDRT